MDHDAWLPSIENKFILYQTSRSAILQNYFVRATGYQIEQHRFYFLQFKKIFNKYQAYKIYKYAEIIIVLHITLNIFQLSS